MGKNWAFRARITKIYITENFKFLSLKTSNLSPKTSNLSPKTSNLYHRFGCPNVKFEYSQSFLSYWDRKGLDHHCKGYI